METFHQGVFHQGAFHKRADSLEHLARGQIFRDISPGGRMIAAPCQGADSLKHLVRGQIDEGISPGGR